MGRRYIIYGRSSCDFCHMACDFLSASSEEFIFLDFEEDQEFIEEIKEFYSFKTVPVILENSLSSGSVQLIGGYTDLLDFLK